MADPPQPTMPASRLNPEAGAYQVTADPEALAASARADARSLERFPYLRARYGARGDAFTRSDGAWLVTMGALPPDQVKAQVAWLGTLLASRGMPRLVLEFHLGALAEELALLPTLAAVGGRLREAHDQLATERALWFDDQALAAWDRRLAQALGPLRDAGPAGCGALLAAAVADERSGLARAVPSLVEWLADGNRFPAGWVAAVTAVLDELRRA